MLMSTPTQYVFLQANVNTLYVTALNPGVTETMLRSFFEGFGTVAVGYFESVVCVAQYFQKEGHATMAEHKSSGLTYS